MILGTVRPLRTDGLDPHAEISFPPEAADQPRGPRPSSQRAEQALDTVGYVFHDEGFDCRVGDKRRRDAVAAAEKSAAEARQAQKAAADGGRAGSAKKGKQLGKGGKEQAAKPAGPLPKGWRCIRKTHASGQREGQHYKAYVSPGGKQYLSYASAQADFGGGKPPPPPKPPPPQAPPQQRRAEYLPPDWAFVKERDGGRTYLGPDSQRIGSWIGLIEELARRDATTPQPPQPSASCQARQGSAQQPPAAIAAAVDPAEAQAGLRSTALWLWRVAREVQHGRCELGADEARLAQRVLRLRLARLRHD